MNPRSLQVFDLPFTPEEIEWRIQSAFESSGKIGALVVPFVQNRAIMDRLDLVVGKENWRNEFQILDDGMLCGLSIRCEDTGEWVTKWDGANRQGQEEDVKFKGGLSGSMKRAGVQWGLGRYLYGLDVGFAEVCGANDRTARYRTRVKIGKGQSARHETIRWNPPKLPKWALPPARDAQGTPEEVPAPVASQGAPQAPSTVEPPPPAQPEQPASPPPDDIPPGLPDNDPKVADQPPLPLGDDADAHKRADLVESVRAGTSDTPEVALEAFCQHIYRRNFEECSGGLLINLARRVEAGEVQKAVLGEQVDA